MRKLKDTYYRGIIGIKILLENSGSSLTSCNLHVLPADFNPFEVVAGHTSAKIKQEVSSLSTKSEAFQVNSSQNAMKVLSQVMKTQPKKKPVVEPSARDSCVYCGKRNRSREADVMLL